jgi:hypothetical protein
LTTLLFGSIAQETLSSILESGIETSQQCHVFQRSTAVN